MLSCAISYEKSIYDNIITKALLLLDTGPYRKIYQCAIVIMHCFILKDHRK